MKQAENMARSESAPKREAFKLDQLKCEHCHAVTEEMVGEGGGFAPFVLADAVVFSSSSPPPQLTLARPRSGN